jgi:hypothetical protein
MPCQYVVVQYGNVMTGEYLNLGLFAYNVDPEIKEVKSRWVADLSRIQTTFGWRDPILESILESWLKKIDTKEALQTAILHTNSPYSSLQFLDPRASLDEDADRLAEDMAKTFLVG